MSVPPNPCTRPPNHEGNHRNPAGLTWARTCTETGPSLLDGAPLQCVKAAGHDLPHEDWAGTTWAPLAGKHRGEQHPTQRVAPETWDTARDLNHEERVQATIDAANAERRARGEAVLNSPRTNCGHPNCPLCNPNRTDGEGHPKLQRSKKYDPSPENFSGGNRLSHLRYGPPFWLAVALAVTWAFVGVTALALLLLSEQLAVAIGVAAIVTAAGFVVGILLFLLLGRVSDG